MSLKQRKKYRVQLFLFLQFQKGPKQQAYLPYLARVVSSGLFEHSKEWAQSLVVSRRSYASSKFLFAKTETWKAAFQDSDSLILYLYCIR